MGIVISLIVTFWMGYLIVKKYKPQPVLFIAGLVLGWLAPWVSMVLVARLVQGLGAGARVDAAGVREHLDTAPCNFFQVRLEVGDKIWRKSCVRIFQSRLCQQRHRDLGQIIHHQVLDVCF